MYSAGDINPRPYFSQRGIEYTFYDDLIDLDRSIKELSNYKKNRLKKNRKKLRDILVVLKRIDENCFGDRNSLYDDLRYYIHDIKELIENRIEDEKWDLGKKNIKINTKFLENRNTFILCGIQDFREMIGNILSNARVHAFKERDYSAENIINIEVATETIDQVDYIIMTYKDNGSGISKFKRKTIFSKNGGMWGRSFHRIMRLGGGVDVISKLGEGAIFKIRFMEVK